MSSVQKQPESSPITACTISRNVQDFDLLIEDMETAMGEAWGDLGFAEALAFFNQPEADCLEFVALAIDSTDEDEIGLLSEIITLAKARGIKVILIAEDVSPASLHQLLRQGADEFVPYPLPENELQAAIDRLHSNPAAAEPAAAAPFGASSAPGDGVLLAVQGLAGGTGATTLAVNLAWELASVSKTDAPRVCILDLGLQTGSVATYLDLPRKDVVYEMWADTDSMDEDIFKQALVPFDDKLWVLTAPTDILPLDMITSEDVQRVLDLARSKFDYVIVDMPSTLVQWTETVLHSAQIYFTTLELDMRSAQNALRLKRALRSEDLPIEKLRFCLNRAPKFTDLNGKSRVKRLAESLEISIEVQLPDGGKPVMQAGDHGTPLASAAGKNPLRKEIAKLAASLHALGQSDAEKAA
ncbi:MULTISPECIES: AAA family ATPase [Roseovarius]|uniref:AAA family ATPase n=1 Tax=Roseovarius TaxID=74030 RepID=UPI001C95400C|nr:AAA family ATPase [Roseovarius atlanticus]MBY5987601.1 AAA family ATPase [Roseovarius atlanticus]MBY6122992.1 AAA family ATPase [Roseovarius atlanticus]MBY6147488.1 AAA family ATPase [Roseovarius atlanticus]